MNSDSKSGQASVDISGLTVASDPWLSSVTGMDCYKVTLTHDPPGGVLQGPAAGGFYTAKISASDVETANAMLDRGFRLVDTNVTLSWDSSLLSQATHEYDTSLEIENVRPPDLAEVESIASSGFRYSRFHLDPFFPNAVADEVKSEWARNLVLGKRGEGCLVARRHGRIVGFLGFLSDPHGRVVVDLVAVNPKSRRKGVGSALVNALQASAYDQGRAIIVGTQIVNRISIRLYESLGFGFHSADHIMHGYATSAEAP